MKAVIISHGEGNRLRPLTCSLPKGMLPVMGRPVIEHTVRLLLRHNINSITILAMQNIEEIKKHFASFSHDKAQVEICLHKNLESFFKEDDTLFISASVLTDTDLERLISFHSEKGGSATLAIQKGTCAYEYGSLDTDKDGVIKGYKRSPDFAYPSGLSFAAIALVSKGVELCDCSDITVLAQKLCEKKLPVFSFCSEGYIRDISDFVSYRRVVRDFFDKKINLPFPCDERAPGVWIDENATVMQGAVIMPPVYIGSGSTINRGARIESYCQIGSNVTIDCFAGIKRSTVMDDSYIYEGASVRGAIVGRKGEIGIESAAYEGSVIGDGTKIGKHCVIRTGVHIWPDKYIEDESCISENIVWENAGVRSLLSDGGAYGVMNREITPEFASMLARAVVTLLGNKIAISCDGGGSGNMIKNALAAGVASGGGTSYDFGEQPLPITRSGVRFYNLDGGIALSSFERSGVMYAALDIINSLGADIEDNELEKIEKLITSSTAKRKSALCIPENEFMFEYKLYYLKQLINSTSKKSLGAKLLIHCPSQWATELLKSAASDLGCIFTFTSVSDKEKFAEEIAHGGYDMGAICDYKCETLTLVTSDGAILSEYDYSALCSLIVMKTYPSASLYIPLSSPESIEIMAQKYGATVHRGKVSPPHLMNELSKGGCELFMNQFVYRFDAVGAIILLLDFLYTHNETLSSLIREIPPSNIVTTSLSCSIKEQSEIMQRLYAIHPQKSDTSDALKISFDNGWVLIVPKKNESVINVISHGYSMEYASELADICINDLTKR